MESVVMPRDLLVTLVMCGKKVLVQRIQRIGVDRKLFNVKAVRS
jgi:hypothetical protein